MTSISSTSVVRRLVLLVLLFAALAMTGCGFNRTGWSSKGRYAAILTTADGTNMRVERAARLATESRHYDRLQLCDHSTFVLYVNATPSDSGSVSELQIEIDAPLCEVGIHQIVGGRVKIATSDVAGGEAIRAVYEEGWTISGAVEIVEYREIGPPPDRSDSRRTVEDTFGYFDLVVVNVAGERVLLENGSFSLAVQAHRYRWDPS